MRSEPPPLPPDPDDPTDLDSLADLPDELPPPPSSTLKVVILLSLVVLVPVIGVGVLAALALWSRHDAVQEEKALREAQELLHPAQDAPVVRVVKVPSPSRTTSMFTVSARLLPVHTVEVVPRIEGHIKRVFCKESTVVKKDTLLVRIDDRDSQLAVDKAQAELDRCKAVAQLADTEMKRARQLSASRAVSEEEVERCIAAAQARAAEVKVADLALTQAKNRLADCQLLAPMDGLVLKIEALEGEFVRAGNKPLVVLAALRPLRVKVEPSPRQRPLLEALPAETVFQFSLANAGPSVREEGTVKLETLLKPDGWTLANTQDRLEPGDGASLRLSASVSVLKVPKTAVGVVDGMSVVQVVKANQEIHFVPVVVDDTDNHFGDFVLVASRELAPEMLLLTEMQEKLREGQKVRPEPAK